MKIKLALLCASTFSLVPFLNRAGAQDCDPVPPNDSRDCNRNGLPDDCDLKPLTPAFHVVAESNLDPDGRHASGSAVVADLDGDGTDEIALLDNTARGIRVYRNLGNGDLREELISTGVQNQASLIAGDWNGDGHVDLAVGNQVTDYLFTLINLSGHGFSPQKGVFLGPDYIPRYLRPGDVDHDGDVDIVLFLGGNPGIAVLSNDSTGQFSAPKPSNVRLLGLVSAELADLDGDGDLDAVVAEGPSEGTLAPLLNDGLGSFALGTRLGINVGGARGLALGDFNADGRMDAATTAYDPDTSGSFIAVSLNQGGGRLGIPVSLGPARAVPLNALGIPRTAADLDGDGDLDLLSMVSEAPELWIYLNETEPRATTPSFRLLPAIGRRLETPGLLHMYGRFAEGGAPALAVFHSGKSVLKWNLSLLKFDHIPYSKDCNQNRFPDECELASGQSFDCDKNGVPDQCEGLPGLKDDCNQNGVPDACELESDCNASGLPDDCDVTSGVSLDGNTDGIPDECQSESFVFAFSGPGEFLGGGANIPFQLDYSCVLIPPHTIAGQGGAQGWVLGVSASGLRITSATAEGTVAANATDEPAGLVNGGYTHTVLTQGEGNEGVVSVVLLSAILPVTLPDDRGSIVLKLTVDGSTPPAGTTHALLYYRNGLQKVDFALPVDNRVTRGGNSQIPFLSEKQILLSSEVAAFRRGDSNADGRVDISDAIYTLTWLFLGGAAPPCLDAADVDDSGDVDISDGHGVNVFLFLGGALPPLPGPFACGVDPTEDSLTCAEGGCGE